MTFESDIDNAYELANFFWSLEENTEHDYLDGKIKRSERNKLVKAIKDSRNVTMKENDPLTKNNALLREIADNLNKFRNIP